MKEQHHRSGFARLAGIVKAAGDIACRAGDGDVLHHRHVARRSLADLRHRAHAFASCDCARFLHRRAVHRLEHIEQGARVGPHERFAIDIGAGSVGHGRILRSIGPGWIGFRT